MSKFERVLSESDADLMGTHLANEIGLDNVTLELIRIFCLGVDWAEQAVLAKLAKQEPVAYQYDDEAYGIDSLAINDHIRQHGHPLYANPFVAPVSDKDGCVSESENSDTQGLPPLPEADVCGYRDGYSEELMLEYAKSAVDHHRTTKNHIAVASKKAPEGWQLVPKEPTEEMHHAARDWSVEKYGKAIGSEASHGCYQAMLAAAPKHKEV